MEIQRDYVSVSTAILKRFRADEAVFLSILLEEGNKTENIDKDWIALSRRFVRHLIGLDDNQQDGIIHRLVNRGVLSVTKREGKRHLRINKESLAIALVSR